MIKKRIDFNQILNHHLKILKSLQYDSGLFAASDKNVGTGYDKSWIRDNFYECLAFFVIGDYITVRKTYSALLKIFLKYEFKIDAAIMHKPKYKHEYIHARFHPKTFEEFWEDWGNKQNDSIGAVLFGIAKIEQIKPGFLLQGDNEIRIVNKLVKYLESLKYWEDEDSGMWEEDEEIHSSSVGACYAGLKEISKIKTIKVNPVIIEKGKNTLNNLLPRESKKKFVDLAQLSLIYPYNVLNKKQRDEILENVEYYLLKEHGVIRYKNDYYYNKNKDGYSQEAEWTFGIAWLAIIYEKLNNKEKARKFILKLKKLDTKKGLPELYFSNSNKPNENTPLGWAEAMFIIALHEFHFKHSNQKKKIFTKLFTKNIFKNR